MVAEIATRKLFIGPRLKRLRRDLALTQTRMAEDLAVSPSYLNLLERNQRPVTAQILLRLAETYDVDLRSLGADGDEQAAIELAEVLSDPLFRDLTVPRHELTDIAGAAPAVLEAVGRLYRAYLEARRREDLAQARVPDRDDPVASDPVDWVRDRVQEYRNHFPDLDARAEAIAGDLAALGPDLMPALRERLRERHQVQLRILPIEVMPDSLRRFDRHRHQLHVSEIVDAPGRIFAAAYQLGLLELAPEIDAVVERAQPPDVTTRRLLRVNLANYAAAAVMMPYGRFLESAESVGYDTSILKARFGTSFEQVCHRLTTLSRPSARGVPFFMIRVDSAGNVSKRFAAGSFPFSRYGGTCPLWTLHATFKIPGKIFTQIVEMPDGARFLSIARTVRRAAPSYQDGESELAVALGCELKYASRLVYGRGLDLVNPTATPIGINCRLCERQHCPQRALPPLAKPLVVDESRRGLSPFSFGP
jgi:predicted transcriptional regulator/DNA-binding XRE family transcriptional regulator